MMKNISLIILFTILLSVTYTQIPVKINYTVESKEIKIDNKFIVYFEEGGNIYYPKIDSNTFIIPEFFNK